MGRGDNLGTLEAMVLAAVLRTQPATGPAVFTELEARTGRDPSLPAIHVTLRRLSAKGLLSSDLTAPSPYGGRRSLMSIASILVRFSIIVFLVTVYVT